MATLEQLQAWHELAQQLRVDSIRATTSAGSGHPTSSMSAADLMAVLLAKYFRYDFSHPHDPNNDHLVFSKGHASPLLYAMYRAAGVIDDRELMSLRRFGSRLEGHPTPVLPWVDVATGSLGQGLPIAAVLDAFVGTGTAPAYGKLALNLVKLAVQDMPGSGTPEELLHSAKIDANAIVEAVQSLV